jgi:3-hydroxybutyryl-CoA dehydrogenase
MMQKEMGEKIFIHGFGMMGAGIAQVFAQSGYEIIASDMEEIQFEKGLKEIARSVNKLVQKGVFKGNVEDVLKRIKTTRDLEEAKEASWVIEAVFEDVEVKKQVFQRLDAICLPNTILASNTSGLLITEIASATQHPERVIGTHFFSPVPVMRLVEVIRGLRTSADVLKRTKDLITSIGKEPIIVEKEIPGFIVNRINGMVYLEALRLLDQGVATAGDIDRGVKLGAGYAMGPFEAMDMIGLDTVLKSRLGIYEQTKDPRFYPPDILKKMVAAGLLGRKTGRGFYEYTSDGKKIL